ncbi:hypothetical protein SDC9_146744 [bioreactor metagenome]|uniref:Uncharacterized protein n=1 Tax=bioreactor metagenome TaxID=1076179 RepID=A0A645EG13_9ZZZZ
MVLIFFTSCADEYPDYSNYPGANPINANEETLHMESDETIVPSTGLNEVKETEHTDTQIILNSDEPPISEEPPETRSIEEIYNIDVECIHDMNNYHYLPEELTQYVYESLVSQEQADARRKRIAEENKRDATDNCEWPHTTIYSFVHDLNVPREVFEQIYNNYPMRYVADYNIDLLYNGTAEEYEQWSIKWRDRFYEHRKLEMEMNFKIDLYWHLRHKDEAHMLKFEESITFDPNETKYTNGYVAEFMRFSIPEMAYEFELSKDEFIECFNKTFEATGGCMYKYDVDRIFDDKEALKKEIAAAKTVSDIYNIDASLRLDG